MLLAGVAVLVVLVVGSVVVMSNGGEADTTETLRGTFVLEPESGRSGTPIEGAWSNCRGTGGYSDFGPGMNVTVRDEAATVVASTQTRSADVDALELLVEMDRSRGWTGTLIVFEDSPTDALRQWLQYVPPAERCVVYFEVEVPQAAFYQISVGRRGELSYSYDELVEEDFTVALTLGR